MLDALYHYECSRTACGCGLFLDQILKINLLLQEIMLNLIHQRINNQQDWNRHKTAILCDVSKHIHQSLGSISFLYLLKIFFVCYCMLDDFNIAVIYYIYEYSLAFLLQS